MKKQEEFILKLQNVLKEDNLDKILGFIEENVICFFSTPNIFKNYQLIKEVDVTTSNRMLPKLIKAWLAFLCGDNAALYSIIKHIDERELKNPYESSCYYALNSFANLQISGEERLKYSKLSVDVLPKEDKSFFMANAKLTYAQILAGLDQYRLSSEIFQEAYELFDLRDADFLSVTALVNKFIKEYTIGEFTKVINEANHSLTMAASFKNETQEYFELIKLPLGMCYFQLNKPSLAIDYLKQAKACIDKLNLFHMYGLTEYYLFKAYYMINDKKGMNEIKEKSILEFGNMHYSHIDIMIGMFEIMSCEEISKDVLKAKVERLEVEYLRCKENSQATLLEIMCYLKIKELTDIISIDDILKVIGKLRDVGRLSDLQLFLIFLAEMYYMESDEKNAEESLIEAVKIYKEYGISANFYLYEYKFLPLVRNIDKKLYSKINNEVVDKNLVNETSMFSIREKEILGLVATGKSNEEISTVLYISIGTVKWHLNHIYSKLQVKNRTQAVLKAKELGELPKD